MAARAADRCSLMDIVIPPRRVGAVQHLGLRLVHGQEIFVDQPADLGRHVFQRGHGEHGADGQVHPERRVHLGDDLHDQQRVSAAVERSCP